MYVVNIIMTLGIPLSKMIDDKKNNCMYFSKIVLTNMII